MSLTKHFPTLAASAALGFVAFAPSVQASTLIDFQIVGGGVSAYAGAGEYGTSSSTWNTNSRFGSASNFALNDDTGAATGVSLTYTRDSSGGVNTTGQYAALGGSAVHTSNPVTLTGLTPGAAFSLVIYSPVAATFTLNSVSASTTGATNWSTLTQGVNYVQFQDVADSSGQVRFASTSSDSGRTFSGLQLAYGSISGSSDPAAPEPGAITLLALSGLPAVGMIARRRKAA